MDLIRAQHRTVMEQKKAEKISKALADPNRIMIINAVKKKKDALYCCEIEEFIDLSQPSICHHLKLLTDTEILIPEKEGRNVKYTLNNTLIQDYIYFLQTLTNT
jgi:ArsR family transcriptional regulator, arsenate/arsenite/antimonite-responsive transcriptional repressor